MRPLDHGNFVFAVQLPMQGMSGARVLAACWRRGVAAGEPQPATRCCMQAHIGELGIAGPLQIVHFWAGEDKTLDADTAVQEVLYVRQDLQHCCVIVGQLVFVLPMSTQFVVAL